ncbi:GNAT family N-acetyltransferase, partial [Rhodopseudomonas sp. B29]|uniref:GNAT family N-acetyltransferase n=1 Tax=Rhodopseudomonas sp. B29 TaxID=95607 RepID=UPI0003B439CB
RHRATPNVFMTPAALLAAEVTGFAEISVLIAVDSAAPDRLLGLWALDRRKPLPLWPETLEALPFYYAFLSTPLIDRDHADAVMQAFVEAIAGAAALPKVLHLPSLDAEAPAYPALRKALTTRGAETMVLSRQGRPVVSREAGLKRSGSTRKKLRQDWNRLSALGRAEIRNDREPAAVAAAFETFLNLELASWKGDRGTAILCHEHDAKFARRLIAELAEQGAASVALLELDGRAIAAQVVMYCGRSAYTWKIGFDAAFARFSPGALLVDKLTEELFAGSDIDAIDSCSVESSFMSTLWTGRRAMVELLVDMGPRKSMTFQMEMVRLQGLQQLRGLRNRLRTWRATRPRKPAMAPQP